MKAQRQGGRRLLRAELQLLACFVPLLSAMVSACVGSETTACSWGAHCPQNMICDDAHEQCVYPAQLDACEGVVDHTPCTFPGSSTGSFWCIDGVCLAVPRCGDSRTDPGEECDDGNTVGGDGCSADCLSDELCGNGIADLAAGEECDEGPANSDTAPDACRRTCRWAFCGDGVIDAGEACDDGNDASGDGCTSACEVEVCGNSVVDAGEECDDGNTVGGDGCSKDCLSDETCGNGVIDVAAGEQCDDGTANSDSAPDACRRNCLLARCGDDVIDAGEACDDGNTTGGDGCSGSCVVEVCGNGVLDPGEGCDDGNQTNSDACPDGPGGSCQPAACGDGFLWNTDGGSEGCDDGNIVNCDGCAGNCSRVDALCGDAIAECGEGCDDGNARSHDGCSSGCTVEARVWVEVLPTSSPTARYGHALVYDSLRHRTVLFGGWDGVDELNETWEYDGVTWTQINTSAAPAKRHRPALAYDSARGVVVLFGGHNGGSTYSDETWEYDGADWAENVINPPNRPPNRYGASLAYDASRNRTVLFGGWSPGGGWHDDTWEYDGTGWTEIFPVNAPASRYGTAMTYDPSRHRVVLFSGESDIVGFDDTWEYDGTDWVELASVPAPSGRHFHGLAYEAVRGRLVLFGGMIGEWPNFAFMADTWEYNGTANSWAVVTSVPSPSNRQTGGVAYDASRERVVLFGGHYYDGTDNLYGDTWESYLDSTWPDEICDNGLDDDSDSVIDCADPDCDGAPCGGGATCSGGVCQ